MPVLQVGATGIQEKEEDEERLCRSFLQDILNSDLL
jgi:hypothetical protein